MTVFGGAFFAVVPVLVIEVILAAYYSFVGAPLTINPHHMVIVYLSTVPFAVWATYTLIQNRNNLLHWKLTETMLIGGDKESVQIPLESVGKVVLGLPHDSRSTQTLQKMIRPAIFEYNTWAKDNSLCLILKTGELLPLYLCTMTPDGAEIMREVRRRLQHVIEHGYKYSANDVSLLRRRGINKLIKKDTA